MENRSAKFWVLLFLFGCVVASGCKDKVPPIQERLAKSWKADMVREGATVVYTRGDANNTAPGYDDFLFVLQSDGSATFTEFNGDVFDATWEATDSRLTLSNLEPEPTGSEGTMEFVINSINDNSLILTRTTESPKTGNTVNEYTLSPL